MNLPGYSPDFNADEAIWGWVREAATGNLCLGTKSRVRERVGNFLTALASRKDEVKRRCRTVLQSRAEELLRHSQARFPNTQQMHIPPWLWFRAAKQSKGMTLLPGKEYIKGTDGSVGYPSDGEGTAHRSTSSRASD